MSMAFSGVGRVMVLRLDFSRGGKCDGKHVCIVRKTTEIEAELFLESISMICV